MKCECEIVFKGDYSAANRVEHHGMHGSMLWNRWMGMKNRCFYGNPNKLNKKSYKGKGIGVCKKWSDSFSEFYKDMGDPPTKNHSLDRINSDLHYCPHNVRWADRKMQSRNRRLNTNGKLPQGVRYRKDTKKYFAVIWMDNKPINIKGCYKTPEEAFEAYIKAKKELHGVEY